MRVTESKTTDKQVKKDTSRCRMVEDAIYRRAKGYKVAVKKTYKVKRVEYDPDTGKKTSEREELATGFDEVHVPADVRAGSYWLNNRDPARWREHPKSDGAGDGDWEEGGFVELPPIDESDRADTLPDEGEA